MLLVISEVVALCCSAAVATWATCMATSLIFLMISLSAAPYFAASSVPLPTTPTPSSMPAMVDSTTAAPVAATFAGLEFSAARLQFWAMLLMVAPSLRLPSPLFPPWQPYPRWRRPVLLEVPNRWPKEAGHFACRLGHLPDNAVHPLYEGVEKSAGFTDLVIAGNRQTLGQVSFALGLLRKTDVISPIGFGIFCDSDQFSTASMPAAIKTTNSRVNMRTSKKS